MGLTDIPIFSLLRTRLEWAQERQRVLADNVANADTPNFRPRDLAPPKFEAPMAPPDQVPGVTLVRTEPGHIAGVGMGGPAVRFGGAFKSHVTGGSVNIEQEMMKVASNTMDYQAVTALYTRSLGLLKSALGKGNG